MSTPSENGQVFGFNVAETATILMFRVIVAEMFVLRFSVAPILTTAFAFLWVCCSNAQNLHSITVQTSPKRPNPIHFQRGSAIFWHQRRPLARGKKSAFLVFASILVVVVVVLLLLLLLLLLLPLSFSSSLFLLLLLSPYPLSFSSLRLLSPAPHSFPSLLLQYVGSPCLSHSSQSFVFPFPLSILSIPHVAQLGVSFCFSCLSFPQARTPKTNRIWAINCWVVSRKSEHFPEEFWGPFWRWSLLLVQKAKCHLLLADRQCRAQTRGTKNMQEPRTPKTSEENPPASPNFKPVTEQLRRASAQIVSPFVGQGSERRNWITKFPAFQFWVSNGWSAKKIGVLTFSVYPRQPNTKRPKTNLTKKNPKNPLCFSGVRSDTWVFRRAIEKSPLRTDATHFRSKKPPTPQIFVMFRRRRLGAKFGPPCNKAANRPVFASKKKEHFWHPPFEYRHFSTLSRWSAITQKAGTITGKTQHYIPNPHLCGVASRSQKNALPSANGGGPPFATWTPKNGPPSAPAAHKPHTYIYIYTHIHTYIHTYIYIHTYSKKL